MCQRSGGCSSNIVGNNLWKKSSPPFISSEAKLHHTKLTGAGPTAIGGGQKAQLTSDESSSKGMGSPKCFPDLAHV